MNYSIAVASGKGGTGKTTVAVSLYNILSNHLNGKVQLIDCDVEEPNDGIFFPDKQLADSRNVFKLLPVINKEKCTWCRKCVEYCEFNAIVVIPKAGFAEVNAGLCHSCSACLAACSDQAISEVKEPIGEINRYNNLSGASILEGKLKIGSAMQTMLIRELKKSVSPANILTIYDAPPGTSCPVVETIVDTDFVILVAEPTPFGLHDLKLMISIVGDLGKPYGVVINKSGLGNDEIYTYLNEQGAMILGEIPFSRVFATDYANGSILDKIPEAIKEELEVIASHVLKRVNA